MLPPFNLNDLPGEWWPVLATPRAQELEDELAREIPDGHALEGRVVTAVAVRRHLKDTVFWLSETSEWALVHLTQRPKSDARWPSTVVKGDWQALVAELV